MFAQNVDAQYWENAFYNSRIPDQLRVTTENTDLIEKVFNNQCILEKILEYTSPDAMNQLKLRLVTKSFCSVILHRIRKQHCTVFIDTVAETNDDSFEFNFDQFVNFDQSSTILVNGQRVNGRQVSLYFKFLNTVANVKVRKLRVEKLMIPSVEERFALHDVIMDNLIKPHLLLKGQLVSYLSISGAQDQETLAEIQKLLSQLHISDKLLEEFVGMAHLCPHGCKKCAMMAESSKIYGPVQMDVMFFFIEQKPSKFETLHLNESFFLILSDKCQLYCSTYEERLNWLNDDITSMFSCDNLVLTLENASATGRYSEIGGGGNGKLSHSFPREIFDIIIRKWNVKNVKLEFRDWDHNTPKYSSFGDYSDDFTKARFDVPFQETPITTKYFLESVEIDLQFLSSVFDSETSFLESDYFDNLIMNARRILPTNEMIVKVPECSHTILDKIIPKLMLMAGKERNFNLTFQLHPLCFLRKAVEILNSGARLLYFPAPIQEDVFVLERIIDLETDGDYRGRSFQLENNLTNSKINFDIFIRIGVLERFFNHDSGLENSGFFRHFWTPEYCL
ncbi:unnamed protein product [Caenorhabditis brenneri]